MSSWSIREALNIASVNDQNFPGLMEDKRHA